MDWRRKRVKAVINFSVVSPIKLYVGSTILIENGKNNNKKKSFLLPDWSPNGRRIVTDAAYFGFRG